MVPPTNPPADTEEILERYRIERAKRIADGRSAALPPSGELKAAFDDPGHPRTEREPVSDTVGVIVIGGGFSGLQLAGGLKHRGVESVRVIDAASDFGGTWYWNRYPGAQCDIESYIYLPLLEETGYIPKEKYSRQPEILDYCRLLAQKFGLYESALFQTKVTKLEWDDSGLEWRVLTDRGDDLRAQYVCIASGPLNNPKLPAIPGIGDFKGHLFHTSRWDYDYTGGDGDGNMDKLGDKVVGIIGTGATAVQVVPHLGASAQKLLVFQRTPSTISPRNNRPTDADWAASLSPGWQKRRRENFASILGGAPQAEDLVGDGWTDAAKDIFIAPMAEGLTPKEQREATELADLARTERIRHRVDEVVQDPATADSLKAYYPYFCKRPCFHDQYLDTFNRPNAQLVDTDGRGVERVTPDGVVVGGTEYPLDCLVLATGFEVGTVDTRKITLDITGRGGQTLADHWADGMSTLYGMMTRGFPNMFFMPSVFTPGVNAQSARLANVSHTLSEVAETVTTIISRCAAGGVRVAEVSEEAERGWVSTIVEAERSVDPESVRSRAYQAKCTPGYFNNEGRPEELRLNDAPFNGTAMQFFGILQAWRDDANLPGLELTRDGQEQR